MMNNMNPTKASTRQLIDVHDMVVVHRAFRREFALFPALVRGTSTGDTARAAVVASHIRLGLRGLHLHHTGEDDLLWPLLLERAAPSTDLIVRMEAQHEQVETLISKIEPAVDAWEVEPRPATADELATLLESLTVVLVEHLDEEEQAILPLAARHLSEDEWSALGEASVAKMSRSQLPLMFGMIMEDATPEERKEMLAVLPPPVRLLMRTWGAWHYRRYVTAVRQDH